MQLHHQWQISPRMLPLSPNLWPDKQIQYISEYPPDQIDKPEPFVINKLQTEYAKEVKSKHVTKNVQKIGMDKHSRQDSPIIGVDERFDEGQRISDIWPYRGHDKDEGINGN